MAGLLQLEVKVTGAAEKSRALGNLLARLRSFVGLWDLVDAELRAIWTQQFASEGAAGASGKWQALSPGYAAWKQAKYPGRTILVLTGTMRESFTRKGHAEHVARRVSVDTYAFGSKVEYAEQHQRGDPGRRLPRRAIIDLTGLDMARLQVGVTTKWVQGQLRAVSALSQTRGD